MLRDGRMELWGDFDQDGDAMSFASSENFVIAFMGSGQVAHFDDKNSEFANIDPVYSSVKIINYPVILEKSMSFRISRGILTGLQDALGIYELSQCAETLNASLKISMVASIEIISPMIIGSVTTLMEIIATIQSVFTATAAVKGIYSTAMRAGNKYDKAEAFARDATMLAVSLIFLLGTVSLVKNCAALFKSASLNLIGRTSPLTASELTQTYKGAKLVTSFDDFAEYAKGFLDEDALLYAKEVLGNDADDIARLKNIAQLIEDGSKKIGKKLSKEEFKAGPDALWDDGGAEGALAVIEWVFKGGQFTYKPSMDGLYRIREYLMNDVEGFEYKPNKVMINKIKEMLTNNQELTGAYKNFYEHELTESVLMEQGFSYKNAHDMALKVHDVLPQALYSPEVIKENYKWFNKLDYEY